MGRDPKRQRLTIIDDTDDETVNDSSPEELMNSHASPGYLAINLSSQSITPKKHTDTWMEAAHAMSLSIDEVSHMIQSQSASYTASSDILYTCFNPQQHADNIDKSILETTVASFAAGMAKQIDSLRQTVTVEGDHPFGTAMDGITTANNSETAHPKWASGPIGHRVGIASVLMTRLKLEVMEPMTNLTMIREGTSNAAEALRIVQNPLLGFVHAAMSQESENPPAPWEIGEHNDEKEQMEREEEEREFMNVYGDERDGNLTESMDGMKSSMMPPSSVMMLIDLPKPRNVTQQQDQAVTPPVAATKPRQEQSTSFRSKSQSQQTQSLTNEYFTTQTEEESTQQQQLQRESAALLSTYQHSDLDSVQKVERSMVEITQLLSRFTDLITEQQEDIFMIHDQAVKSKENVDKGQDQLVDAARRGEKSRHPMASFILLMGLMLLFFNWILP